LENSYHAAYASYEGNLTKEEKPDKGSSSSTDGKEKSVEGNASEDSDWEERDVLLRTWI